MCVRWRRRRRSARSRIPTARCGRRDADACCDFRKTIPLARALAPFKAQVTGRKRFQTRERADMLPVEFLTAATASIRCGSGTCSSWKPLPSATTCRAHPLVEDGYPSIGCMPCTRRVQAGEDYRAGRWSGLDKDECGIHLTDGGGI